MQTHIARDFQQAVQLQQQGQLDAAANVCQKVIDQVPQEPDPLHLLGLIRKQQGQFDEAERLLRASVEKAPARPHFHGNLGNLLHSLDRYADAERAYRQALALDASFRPARLGLARTLNDAGVYDAAEKEARTLIAANAGDAEALSALGVALAGQARYEDAEAAYRAALKIAPGYGAARHNLGAMLAKAERVEESLVELELAKQAGVTGVEIEFNTASALMKLYRFDDGEQLLSSTVAKSPTYADAQKLLAQFRFMRGAEDFAGELARATKAFPASPELQLAYGQVLHGANLVDEAEQALQEALQHCGPHPRLLGLLATVYQEAGRYEEALESGRAAVRENPDDSLLVDYVIDALMSLGRADEALPLINAARKRVPNNQWYIAIESTAARLLGDPHYAYLCDYEAMVRPYELEPPPGVTNMEEFHRELLPALHKRHKFHAHPLDQSLRLGTQTPRNLIGDPDPVIQGFIAMLDESITAYRTAIGVDRKHPLRSRNHGKAVLTGCWSVRLQRGGYHVNHVHPEGWISSAYYAEVPAEVADEQSKSGWIKFGEPRYPVPGATPEKYVQPRPGRLVLFPSYMWHGTTPIHGDEPRMTIAFDVVTDSNTG
jgi:tetratricopeptide (TPR) repeat protein